MRILKLKKEVEQFQTTVYDVIEDRILYTIPSLKIDDVMQCLGQEGPIDYLCIPLNQPYRQACLSQKQIRQIVVDQEQVSCFLKRVLGADFFEYLEEAAASVVEDMSQDQEVTQFLKTFYLAKTKEEAETLYNKWQECLPVNSTLCYKILRTFESYRLEILNYFEVKACIEK